jgi:hypothetical protein
MDITPMGNIIVFGLSTGICYSYKINEEFLKAERLELDIEDKRY